MHVFPRWRVAGYNYFNTERNTNTKTSRSVWQNVSRFSTQKKNLNSTWQLSEGTMIGVSSTEGHFTVHCGPESPQLPWLPLTSTRTHSLLLRCAGRGGGWQTLLPVHQFAAGFPQGSLQLVDAGLVLQQNILWLIQKLEEREKDMKMCASQTAQSVNRFRVCRAGAYLSCLK